VALIGWCVWRQRRKRQRKEQQEAAAAAGPAGSVDPTSPIGTAPPSYGHQSPTVGQHPGFGFTNGHAQPKPAELNGSGFANLPELQGSANPPELQGSTNQPPIEMTRYSELSAASQTPAELPPQDAGVQSPDGQSVAAQTVSPGGTQSFVSPMTARTPTWGPRTELR
jgi:hypothetical protein